MRGPKLNAEELAWLRKFERAFGGRGSVAQCDELGFSEKARLEAYRNRRRRRNLAAARAGTKTVSLKENLIGNDPMDAMIELIDRKARAKRR